MEGTFKDLAGNKFIPEVPLVQRQDLFQSRSHKLGPSQESGQTLGPFSPVSLIATSQ